MFKFFLFFPNFGALSIFLSNLSGVWTSANKLSSQTFNDFFCFQTPIEEMDETFFTGGDPHAVNSKDEDGNIHAGPYTVKEKYGPNSYKRRRDAARKFLITGIKNKGKQY